MSNSSIVLDDIDEEEANTSASVSIERVENQPIIKELIQAYHNLPELWDPRHQYYTNKFKRNAAYDILLGIMRKAHSSATRYHVRMKINSLRSNYRKELRKHRASKTIGPNGEEIYTYTPQGWKFYALSFLNQVERDTDSQKMEMVTVEDSTYEENSELSPAELDIQLYEDVHTMYETKSKKKRLKYKEETEVYSIPNTSSADGIDSSEFEAIGANVALKLKRMDPLQRYHAELLINKVLINGLRHNLSDETDLTELQVLTSKTCHEP